MLNLDAGPSGRAVARCARGFESHQRHECFVCSVLSLRRADHSSRGVLPTEARRCV
jgi:hypothetical protein